MSPLSRQSTLFLQSRLTEEFHSEFLWADDSATSVFHGGTSQFFGGALTALDDPPALPTINLLSSFEDDRLGPSSVSPEDLERINDVTNGHNVPFGIRPEDLYVTFSLFSLVIIDRD